MITVKIDSIRFGISDHSNEWMIKLWSGWTGFVEISSAGYLRVAVQPVLDDENGDYASGVKQSARISFADGCEKSQTVRECHESAVGDRIVEGQGSGLEDPVDTKERPDDVKESVPAAADHLTAGKDFTFRVTILHAVNIPAEYSDVFCQVVHLHFGRVQLISCPTSFDFNNSIQPHRIVSNLIRFNNIVEVNLLNWIKSNGHFLIQSSSLISMFR